jgi:hypothetical protein
MKGLGVFYFILLGNSAICKEVLAFVNQFIALCFMATSAPLATRCIKILPMNQYAC